MALEGNTMLPQHKPQTYRAERSNNNSTVETNEGLNPQFNLLHSSHRSCNAKERINTETNSRDKKHNFLPQKQIAGPAIQKLQDSNY